MVRVPVAGALTAKSSGTRSKPNSSAAWYSRQRSSARTLVFLDLGAAQQTTVTRSAERLVRGGKRREGIGLVMQAQGGDARGSINAHRAPPGTIDRHVPKDTMPSVRRFVGGRRRDTVNLCRSRSPPRRIRRGLNHSYRRMRA